MAMKRYKMLKDSGINKSVKAGDFVYDTRGWDYGVASDDTRMTGVEHTSVTLDPNGDYPFFTVPKLDLELA